MSKQVTHWIIDTNNPNAWNGTSGEVWIMRSSLASAERTVAALLFVHPGLVIIPNPQVD